MQDDLIKLREEAKLRRETEIIHQLKLQQQLAEMKLRNPPMFGKAPCSWSEEEVQAILQEHGTKLSATASYSLLDLTIKYHEHSCWIDSCIFTMARVMPAAGNTDDGLSMFRDMNALLSQFDTRESDRLQYAVKHAFMQALRSRKKWTGEPEYIDGTLNRCNIRSKSQFTPGNSYESIQFHLQTNVTETVETTGQFPAFHRIDLNHREGSDLSRLGQKGSKALYWHPKINFSSCGNSYHFKVITAVNGQWYECDPLHHSRLVKLDNVEATFFGSERETADLKYIGFHLIYEHKSNSHSAPDGYLPAP